MVVEEREPVASHHAGVVEAGCHGVGVATRPAPRLRLGGVVGGGVDVVGVVRVPALWRLQQVARLVQHRSLHL